MSFIFNYEHIQCVRTNYIIAVTCRLVDSLTCRLESVRDWSGILLERGGDGVREREQVTEPAEVTGVSTDSTSGSRKAEKDIAESPTASPERPNQFIIYNS